MAMPTLTPAEALLVPMKSMTAAMNASAARRREVIFILQVGLNRLRISSKKKPQQNYQILMEIH
jgi:hypothetical protein